MFKTQQYLTRTENSIRGVIQANADFYLIPRGSDRWLDLSFEAVALSLSFRPN
jgi:hypothetical protein